MWLRRKGKSAPAEAVRGLRERALTIEATSLGLAPGGPIGNVWAVLMETGYPQAVASLVAVGDGAASLYFSNGGGIIGAGEYDSVRRAVFGLLASAEGHLGSFSAARGTPLPAVGRVCFYLRTFGGTLAAEASENDLGENHHVLSGLFTAGHTLIAAIREASTSERSS